MTNSSRPTPEQLAADLAAMLRTGVTIQSCRQSHAIRALPIVHAKATSDEPDDLAVAANHLIREACASVDSITEGPTAILLAVAPGYRGTLLKKRRTDAAKKLYITPGHLRDEREEPLLEAVADELYGMDSAYRLRHRHRTESEREPQDSGLRVDWLAQHRSYRRIWTPISGLCNDLVVLLGYLLEAHEAGVTPDDVGAKLRADISDRLSSMTWYLARFSAALEDFVEREGGLWILADADSEIRVADNIYRAQVHLPFGEADVSWARLLLKRTEAEELDPYIDRLIEAGDRRREFMQGWIEWAWRGIEHADPIVIVRAQKPPSNCGTLEALEDASTTDVGHWIAAATDLIGLIDDDWYQLADWYRSADSAESARASET